MLFCSQLAAGTQAPPWKGSSPPYGRGLLKAVPCFPSRFFLSAPDLLSAAVIPPGCDPSVVSRALFRRQGGRYTGMVCAPSAAGPRCPGGLLWAAGGAALPALLCCRHTYQSDSSLVISHVEPGDAGTYTCRTSDGSTESRQIQLQITGELSSARDRRGNSGLLINGY